MADDSRGISLVILGIVAIVAVIGLVLLFAQPTLPGGKIVSPWDQPKPPKGPIATPEDYWTQEAAYGGGALPTGISSGEFEGIAHRYCRSVCYYYGEARYGFSKCIQCIREVSRQITGIGEPEELTFPARR